MMLAREAQVPKKKPKKMPKKVAKNVATAAASRPAGAARRRVGAKRRRRSADDLLNRIVQAAAGEFKRRGFAGTTTAAIASKADVTEAQLFRYFGSKSNLFRETIFKPVDQHLLHFIDTHMPDGDDPADARKRTQLYTTELQRFISRNSQMLTSLVVAQTYDAGTTDGVAQINSLNKYFERSAAIMTSRLKGEPRVDPKLLVRLAFASVLASVMFREWIFPPGLATDEQIDAATIDFMLEGIGANASYD